MKGEGAPAMRAPENCFNLHSVSADYGIFPREKVTVRGEKTVNHMDNVVKILCITPIAPETTKLYTIELQVSEVTSVWFNGTMWL